MKVRVRAALIGACAMVAVFGPMDGEAAEAEVLRASVAERLKGQLPPDWSTRLSWRETTLAIYVTPPTSQGFDLIYKPEATSELIRKLCPGKDDALWATMTPEQDIAIIPSVLGKSGVRTSCRKLAATPSS